MREIGVRDLKAQLSSVLRKVEAGERVRVTSRGRPVAEIVPAELPEGQWERMVAEGRITPARRPPSEASPPTPRKTGRSASAIILAEREEDR